MMIIQVISRGDAANYWLRSRPLRPHEARILVSGVVLKVMEIEFRIAQFIFCVGKLV